MIRVRQWMSKLALLFLVSSYFTKIPPQFCYLCVFCMRLKRHWLLSMFGHSLLCQFSACYGSLYHLRRLNASTTVVSFYPLPLSKEIFTVQIHLLIFPNSPSVELYFGRGVHLSSLIFFKRAAVITMQRTESQNGKKNSQTLDFKKPVNRKHVFLFYDPASDTVSLCGLVTDDNHWR